MVIFPFGVTLCFTVVRGNRHRRTVRRVSMSLSDVRKYDSSHRLTEKLFRSNRYVVVLSVSPVPVKLYERVLGRVGKRSYSG